MAVLSAKPLRPLCVKTFALKIRYAPLVQPPPSPPAPERLGVRHAFQVVMNLPYEDVDSFALDEPTVVPARTFLSQLP